MLKQLAIRQKMQNKKIQTIKKSEDFVFDNKVSGVPDAVVKKQMQLEMRLRHCNSNLSKSSSEVEESLAKIVRENISVDNNKRLKTGSRQTDNIRKQIEKSLSAEIGSAKATNIANQFVKDLTETNLKKASEKFVKNFEESSKRFSGLKIEAFERKKDGINYPKYDKEALIKRMIVTGQIAPKIPVKMAEDLSDVKESTELTSSLSRHMRLRSMRDMAIRQMRRNVRSLSSQVKSMIDINNADNGIAFNEIGVEHARFAQERLAEIRGILNTGENMISKNNGNVATGSDLNIDALLQRGRSSMVQVSIRSRGLHRHLIKQRESEQERVRC